MRSHDILADMRIQALVHGHFSTADLQVARAID